LMKNEDMFVCFCLIFFLFFFGFSPPPAKQIYSCHLIKNLPPNNFFFSPRLFTNVFFVFVFTQGLFFNDDNSIINGRTSQKLGLPFELMEVVQNFVYFLNQPACVPIFTSSSSNSTVRWRMRNFSKASLECELRQLLAAANSKRRPPAQMVFPARLSI
jgi:hypothetical protein